LQCYLKKTMAQSSDRKVKINQLKVSRSIAIAVISINILSSQPASALPLSPGDRIRLLIPEGELFNGVYEVNTDGTISIPYLPNLPVVGLEISLLQERIKNQLIEKKYFKASFLQVSLTPLLLAPIEVNVSGETFQTGRVQINNRSPEVRAQQLSQSSGDYAPERFLTAALRSAGGVMPTADVSQITVIRHNKKITVDFTGIFTGEEVIDIPLVAGDLVVVPKRLGIDPRIVRPSQITPPGILVFLSNLSIPGNSNSTSGINKDTTGFPYGARFSQAVFASNCVGGTISTNAARRAVLVRTNRGTGETVAIDRAVEDLIRNSQDDITNPFLMPQDSVSCYDSTVTEVRGVLDFIGNILNPIKLIRDIFSGSNR
jgi:polysaccharide biosynthesis/export protein